MHEREGYTHVVLDGGLMRGVDRRRKTHKPHGGGKDRIPCLRNFCKERALKSPMFLKFFPKKNMLFSTRT